jgi:hypothetical protein
LRVFASISPWLPLLKDFLYSVTVLEEKAAELYQLSLLEKPISSSHIRETVLGVEKSGKALQSLNDHLLRQGFKRQLQKVEKGLGTQVVYFREDLGSIRFLCPLTRNQGFSCSSI